MNFANAVTIILIAIKVIYIRGILIYNWIDNSKENLKK